MLNRNSIRRLYQNYIRFLSEIVSSFFPVHTFGRVHSAKKNTCSSKTLVKNYFMKDTRIQVEIYLFATYKFDFIISQTISEWIFSQSISELIYMKGKWESKHSHSALLVSAYLLCFFPLSQILIFLKKQVEKKQNA